MQEQKFEPGMYDNITSDDYHAAKGISSSDLKKAKTMAHFMAHMNSKKKEKKSKGHFDLGKAAHSAILEQDFSAFIKGPDVHKNTIKWKDFVNKNKGKVVLKPEEYECNFGMYEAFYSHPLAPKLLAGCIIEHSFFTRFEDTSVMLKTRPDALNINESYILDYKTTLDPEPFPFAKQCDKFGYHISLALYGDVVEQVTKKKITDYWIIAQEKVAPFGLMVHKLNPVDIELGRRIYMAKLFQVITALKDKEWPGYKTEINMLALPDYAHAREINDL